MLHLPVRVPVPINEYFLLRMYGTGFIIIRRGSVLIDSGILQNDADLGSVSATLKIYLPYLPRYFFKNSYL